MKTARILFSVVAIASLLSTLCTQATFDNPIDKNGTGYVGDSLAADSNHNGIADYYDHLTPVNIDKVPPVITFVGGDTVVVAQNDPKRILEKDTIYAHDNIDGDISGSVTASGAAFTSQCSTYTITYSVSDKAGNQTQKSRVIIVDCYGPVITLRGRNPDSIVVGKKYSDPGATAVDNIDGVVSVTPPPAPNTSKEGVDTLIYTATDKVGNTSKATRILVVYIPAVIDSIPPVIILIGSRDTTIKTGTIWTEPGYSASDNIDGNVTASVVVSGSVNTALTGTYTIAYNVSDKAGNAAAQQTRKVTVVKSTGGPDVTPPLITLKGKNPDTVTVAPGTYTDPGYTATDDVDGDVTANVVVTELYNKPLPINTGSAGSYILVYTVSDKAGNKASATRYVYVLGASNDKTPPVINLIGAAACTVTVGKTYTDPGVTAIDDVDGIITNKVKDTLTTAAGVGALMATFTNTAGSYKITYTVSDAAGNAATPKIRSILVQDTTGFGNNLLIKYGVPLKSALPAVNVTYSSVSTDGAGAPNVSNINKFQFNWGGSSVYTFGLGTSNGVPNYYVDLTASVNGKNTFSQASPGFTLSGSGFTGLDGSYYIKADATQCVWVKTDGSFAIVFKP